MNIPYKILSSKQRRLLEKILLTQSKSGHEWRMVSIIEETLEDISKENNIQYHHDNMGNIFVIKDNLHDASINNYPLFIAHTDTVHDIKETAYADEPFKSIEKHHKYILYKYPTKGCKGYTYDTLTGIGGDDKNGIFILLSMLFDKRIPRMKALFPVQEENGCKGVKHAYLHNKDFFNDIAYIIEPDRRGNADIIAEHGNGYSVSSEFLEYVQPIWNTFSYSIEKGTITDAFYLFEQLNVSTFNISCGYHKPHTKWEYVVEHEISRTLNTLICIAKTVPLDKIYHKKYEEPAYMYGDTYNRYGYGYGHGYPKTNRNKKENKALISSDKIIRGYFFHPVLGSKHIGIFNTISKDFQIYTETMDRITYTFSHMERLMLFMVFVSENLSTFKREKVIDILDFDAHMSYIMENLNLFFYDDIIKDFNTALEKEEQKKGGQYGNKNTPS